jgi:6,7-dimethyl-8-ribityllumazine synthase
MTKIAIVVSEFNAEINQGLAAGARERISEEGEAIEIAEFSAPGAYEMPLLAKSLARKGFDGVICLGTVIKGETAHFEFISLGASTGLMQAMLDTDTPIAFGILTTYDRDQAERRSRPGSENKGREAANACLSTLKTLRSL